MYHATMVSNEEAEDDGDIEKKINNTGRSKGRADEPRRATDAKKQPPPEAPDAVWLRTKVILSFWAVIVFLGLPVWWQTTSIYRARLPIQEMLEWSRGTVWLLWYLHIDHC